MQKKLRRAYVLSFFAACCAAAMPVHASQQETGAVEEKLRIQQALALEYLRPQALASSAFLQQQLRMPAFFDSGKEALPSIKKEIRPVSLLPLARAAYVLGEGSQISKAMFSLAALLQRLLNGSHSVEKLIRRFRVEKTGFIIGDKFKRARLPPDQSETDRVVNRGAPTRRRFPLRYFVWFSGLIVAGPALACSVRIFRWSLFWVSWLQLRGPPTR